MTTLVVCAALFAHSPSSNASIDARRATDELIKTIPREVAAVAVLEDLDGFLSRIEQSELLKRVRQSKLLGASIEQSGQLPKALVSLVSLRVAAINGCPF